MNKLLVVDDAVITAQKRQIQDGADDPRTAAELERVWSLKNADLQNSKSAQRDAEREADECEAQLDSVSKATDKLRKMSGSEREVAKLERKISELQSRLVSARESASRNKRIAKARKELLENWLQERFRSGPTNLEIVENARIRDKALAAVWSLKVCSR